MGDGAGTASRWTGFTLVALVGGDRAGFAPRVSGSSREKDVGKVPGCRPAPGAATATRWPPTSSTSCPGSLDRRVERPPLGRGAAAAAGRPRRGAAAAAGRPTRAWLRCLAPASPCESEGEEGDGPDDQALFHVKQLVQVGPPSWASGPPLRSPALSREAPPASFRPRVQLVQVGPPPGASVWWPPSGHQLCSRETRQLLRCGSRVQLVQAGPPCRASVLLLPSAAQSCSRERATRVVAVHSSSKLDRRAGDRSAAALQLPSPVRVKRATRFVAVHVCGSSKSDRRTRTTGRLPSASKCRSRSSQRPRPSSTRLEKLALLGGRSAAALPPIGPARVKRATRVVVVHVRASSSRTAVRGGRLAAALQVFSPGRVKRAARSAAVSRETWSVSVAHR